MNTFPLQFVALSAQEKHWAFTASLHGDALPPAGGMLDETWQRHVAVSHDKTPTDTARANLTWLPRQ